MPCFVKIEETETNVPQIFSENNENSDIQGCQTTSMYSFLGYCCFVLPMSLTNLLFIFVAWSSGYHY